MALSQFQAQLKIARGEWTVAEALTAIEQGEVAPPPVRERAADPQDWDEVDAAAEAPPFASLVPRHITVEERDELAAAMYAARERGVGAETVEPSGPPGDRFVVQPSKPWSEMTDDDLDSMVDSIFGGLSSRVKDGAPTPTGTTAPETPPEAPAEPAERMEIDYKGEFSQVAAERKVLDGEWTFDDLVEALRAGRIDATRYNIDPGDWGDIENRAQATPFTLLRQKGAITRDQQRQLLDELHELFGRVERGELGE